MKKLKKEANMKKRAIWFILLFYVLRIFALTIHFSAINYETLDLRRDLFVASHFEAWIRYCERVRGS